MSLQDLNEELAFPGVDALYTAAKRRRLTVTKAQVRQFVQAAERKQVLAPRQPSLGKTATESIDSRWMCDLLVKRPSPGSKAQYALV